jgi:hypothetical protein
MTIAARKIEPVPADPLEVFKARALARAHLYAAGEFDLHDAVDVLQEAAIGSGLVEQIGQDAAQAIIAAAFAPARNEVGADVIAPAVADTPYDDDPDGDYSGLMHSFARLCMAADAEHKSKASNPRAPAFHIAASTLAAADYLTQQNDPARMCAWLAHRSAREVEVIWQHIKQKGGT